MTDKDKSLLLAKSDISPQFISIEQHNKDLLERYEQLKKSNYLNQKIIDEYDELIVKMIKFHDLGKMNYKFQNKIIKSIKSKLRYLKDNHNSKQSEHIKQAEELIKLVDEVQITELKDYKEPPHEWLSLCFLSKNDRRYLHKLNKDGIDFLKLIPYCIAMHHSRSKSRIVDFNEDVIAKFVENDLEKNKHKLGIDYPLTTNFNIIELKNFIETPKNFPKYVKYLVFFKGLLHKCDYSASAGIDAEKPYEGNYSEDFQNWLNEQSWKLKDYQEEAEKLSDKSIIFIASTGAGKTEYSMNWINGSKAFYLLGIRIAVNKMYDRFKKVFGDNTALVHSDANYKWIEEISEEEDYFRKTNTAKRLSYPLTIATADQLITSVFKYNGFELPYFIASYSKIVVDEIQSFSPEAIASIVMFLKEIHSLGGKFLLMTATLPPFIKKEFEELGAVFPKPVLSTNKRHWIKMTDRAITDDETTAQIKDKFDEGKKVLVICNTVKVAQEMYENLESLSPNLIHSRFIGMDRREKEDKITEDGDIEKNKGNALWISTQIVEASLDIDFDVMFTEASTVDSLFQRFGRCYRKREYPHKEPNIFILKPGDSSKLIYDSELMKKTEEELNKYDNRIITEADKQKIIEKVFQEVEDTKYYSKYKQYKELLTLGFKADSKSDAQWLFRRIANTHTVIPEPVYKTNEKHIDELLSFIDNKNNPIIERIKKRIELNSYTVSIQVRGKAKIKLLEEIVESQYCTDYNIKKLNGVKYSKEKGLVFDPNYKDESNFIW
jgi:CRISPR-associated endonuclease/helicase Cas3